MVNRVMFHYYIEPKVIPNLLTEDEIEYIKKKSIDKLEPSTIGDLDEVKESTRISETTVLSREDPIIDNLMRKCVGLTNKPIGHCEKLQVTRYKTGGFYKPHQDVILKYLPNIRQYTFIFALNDYEGGETSFPNLDIKFKLKKGDCLFFHTLDNHEQYTSMALHAGEPVKSGEKWICNLWVHKYPYTHVYT
jgi:hypothetical protein